MAGHAGVLTDLGRLRAMAAYDLFHPALKQELQDVCRRTAAEVGVPVAAVQAVLDTATACLATNDDDGLLATLGGAPNELSVCPAVVVTGRPVVAADLGALPEFATHPAVVGGHLRAYAGVPLVTEGGAVIGSHCVMSAEVHEFSERDVAALTAGAAGTMDALARHPMRR